MTAMFSRYRRRALDRRLAEPRNERPSRPPARPLHSFQTMRSVRRKLTHELELHYPDNVKKAPALIRVADDSASGAIESLQSAIVSSAPAAGLTKVTGGENAGVISVDLTGPAVATLAKAIQSWLSRNTGVQLELVTNDGKKVSKLTSDNVVKTLSSTMAALRK